MKLRRQLHSARGFATLAHDVFGEPRKVLRLVDDAPVPSPGPGQVCVRVSACQVLPEDLRAMRGLSLHRRRPGIAGSTGVGTVISVGAGVPPSSLQLGDSVLVLGGSEGVWGAHCLADAAGVHRLPALLEARRAALLPSLLCAHHLLTAYHPLQPGDKCLMLAGPEPCPSTRALSAVAEALGVVLVSSTERGSKFGLCLTSQPAAALDCARALGPRGTLVVYTGPTDPMAPAGKAAAGVSVPVSSSIFTGTRVCGFALPGMPRAAAERSLAAVLELAGAGRLDLPSAAAAVEAREAAAAVEGGAGAVIVL